MCGNVDVTTVDSRSLQKNCPRICRNLPVEASRLEIIDGVHFRRGGSRMYGRRELFGAQRYVKGAQRLAEASVGVRYVENYANTWNWSTHLCVRVCCTCN